MTPHVGEGRSDGTARRPAVPRQKPGTPSLLRELNDRAALELLLAEGPLTRAQLSERTGVSKVTVSQMLASGEKSGKLSQVMEAVSGFAEQELKEQITELTRYVEPIMIMVMGFIIGGVAMALLLPVFTISRVMSQ